MLGVFAGAVCQCLVGMVVYNGKLPTGRLWMSRTFPGKSEKEIGEASGSAYAFSIVAAITVSLVLKFLLIDFLHAKLLLDGIKFAVGLASLLIVLEIPHVIFSRRSIDLFIIDQIHNLLALTAAAACIVYLN